MGIRVGGLSSGLDTAALIEAFINFERRPLDLVEQRKLEIETNKKLFLDLNTKLAAVRDAAAELDNLNSTLTGPTLDEELLEFTTTSSNEGVLTATANGNASPGSLDIDVQKVATVGRQFSAAYADNTAIIANSGDTINITHGGANPISITVGATGASLQDIRDSINTDVNNTGNVRAEILFDGSNYRLVASAAKSGIANDVALTSSIAGFVDGTISQAADDAQVTVFGGITIASSENTIASAIPGVTISLHNANPGVPVTLDVGRDDEKIAEKFQTFVDAYNTVIDFVNDQSRFNEATQAAGPLSGNPTLRGLRANLQTALQGSSANPYAFAGNSLRSIGEFGVELGRDGRLSLDVAELSSTLDKDPFAVREFLSGDGTPTGLGVAASIAAAIDPFTESATGILANIDKTLADRVKGFEVQIERMEARLERREELLVAQFARLETSLSQLQAQGNALSGIQNFNQNRN